MKKLIISISILCFLFKIPSALAEAWIPDYGYYENSNEISAKKELISNINPDNIFDFNTSANPGGEKIVDGKYYIPIMYNGGYNGTDTDYIYASEFKGEKGDTGLQGVKGNTGLTGAVGAKGEQGIQGNQGVAGANGFAGENGTNGVNGKDGYTPIKDVDYFDGKNGEQGEKGEQGIQGLQGLVGEVGEQGVAGLNGENGHTPVKGEDYNDGKDGATGEQGKQGDKGDTGKGLENRTELVLEGRVFDTRKWAGFIYGGRDFNNDVSIVGAKLQYKFGKSYEERRLDELERKLNLLTETNVNPDIETYVTTTGLGIRERRQF